MSAMDVFFYRLADGCFTGQSFSGAPKRVAANTPEGCAAFEGLIDHLSQRVDLTSGELLDWQPEAPPGDEWRTWRWDAKARRYVGEPTAAAVKRAASAPVLAQLAALDQAAIRPLVEIAAALTSATAAPAEAKTVLDAILEQKGELRQQLRDIEAGAEEGALKP